MNNEEITFDDRTKALIAADIEGAIELIKLMPGAGVFIETYRAYKEKLKDIQLSKFLDYLEKSMLENKKIFEDNFYLTESGKLFTYKIFENATNYEYAEKTEYFINALINGRNNESEMERLRFIDMIKNISKPSLLVLAQSIINYKDNNKNKIPSITEIASQLSLDQFLVDSCIKELSSHGVFSNNIGFGGPGNQVVSIVGGTVAITAFTIKFGEFIQNYASKDVE